MGLSFLLMDNECDPEGLGGYHVLNVCPPNVTRIVFARSDLFTSDTPYDGCNCIRHARIWTMAAVQVMNVNSRPALFLNEVDGLLLKFRRQDKILFTEYVGDWYELIGGTSELAGEADSRMRGRLSPPL